MTIGDVIVVALAIALVANAVALVRYWQAMRVFTIALNNLIATQKQFNELMDDERRNQANDARPPPWHW